MHVAAFTSQAISLVYGFFSVLVSLNDKATTTHAFSGVEKAVSEELAIH